MVIQIICMWAFFGALFFALSNTPKLFKSKKWAIVTYGPLVWYAVLVAKVTGQLNTKDTK